MSVYRRALIAILAFFGFVIIALPTQAIAHVLKQNNGVSAVMHISPDDNPVAGTPTLLEFTFGNASDDFSLADYDLSAMVVENTATVQQVAITPAAVGATAQGVATVTFPQIDTYQLVVNGRSKHARVADFRVDYLVRVATGANGASMPQGDGAIPLLAGAAGLILLTMVAVRNIARGRRYVARSK